MKRIHALSVVLLITGTVLNGCGGGKKPDIMNDVAQEEAYVKIDTLKTSRVARVIEYPSNLEAIEQVNLVPVSPGRIDRIYVEEGSRVSKGQLLVEMDKTSLHQAKIQLATLENDFKRYEVLKETGAIAQQTYDQAQAQLNIQRTNIAFLEKNTAIRAPFSGIITAKNYENGELYSGAKPILTLVEIDRLKAYIDVPESYYPGVNKGMKVTVKSEIYPDKPFEGVIFNVSPTINSATRTFEVEVHIPNRQEMLKPGMFARISLSLGETNALIVPYQTVLKLQVQTSAIFSWKKEEKLNDLSSNWVSDLMIRWRSLVILSCRATTS
jgi:RND family efflux transporter MFP subunit